MLLGVRSLELVPFLGMWQERGRNAFLLISRERAFHAPRSFFEHANFTEIYYLKIRCVKVFQSGLIGYFLILAVKMGIYVKKNIF